jgi:DNA polymerase III subunit gamma/tau
MSFYRTHRPQLLQEIDNVAVREAVLRMLGKPVAELPHAFFFSGPKGTGKTTVARLIAKLYNCENLSPKSGPCGVCGQCLTIAKGTNMDVLEIDAASNRGIDEIRGLRDRIGLMPSGAKHTIYIIDEVHMLTNEAFNALLKTLEEPPAHAVFVLATTDPQKVPATVKSRCLTLNFKKATKEEITGTLKRIVEREKLQIEDSALEVLVASADGSFRDAVKLLEQVSLEKGKISADTVRRALSLGNDRDIDEFIATVQAGSTGDALTKIEAMVGEGIDIRSFMVQVMGHLEHMLVEQAKKDPGATQVSFLKRCLALMGKAYADLRWSPIAQLPLELAVIELHQQPVADGWAPKAPPAKPEPTKPTDAPQEEAADTTISVGLITLEKLVENWKEVIEALKPLNHSIAGVLRSAKPNQCADGVVVIETFYKFHMEKLSESKTKDMISGVLKKLFGEKVKVNIVLGKK